MYGQVWGLVRVVILGGGRPSLHRRERRMFEGFSLVLLRLRRRSVNFWVNTDFNVCAIVATFATTSVETCALILGSKCMAPFSPPNVATVWGEKTTAGKHFCRKGHLKKGVKDKTAGTWIRIQNDVLHVIYGEKLPNPCIFPLAKLLN